MLDEVRHAISKRPTDTRLVFLSDYDGTLADFHPDPTIPRPPRRTLNLLRHLAARPDISSGIVSGRRIADLRTRTQPPTGVYLAGLHGMEIEVGLRRWQHPDLDAARVYVRELNEQLDEVRAKVPGMVLEDKHASIVVHVRGVKAELRERALALAEECAEEWMAAGRLRRLPGNHVVEFLPNIACHKGDATQWIARDVKESTGQRPWLVFVGDDFSDEDAFKAIDHGIGVLVGNRETAAQYQLGSTADVVELLAWLVREA